MSLVKNKLYERDDKLPKSDILFLKQARFFECFFSILYLVYLILPMTSSHTAFIIMSSSGNCVFFIIHLKGAFLSPVPPLHQLRRWQTVWVRSIRYEKHFVYSLWEWGLVWFCLVSDVLRLHLSKPVDSPVDRRLHHPKAG